MLGSFSPNFPALRPDVGLPPNRLPRGLPLSLHTAVGSSKILLTCIPIRLGDWVAIAPSAFAGSQFMLRPHSKRFQESGRPPCSVPASILTTSVFQKDRPLYSLPPQHHAPSSLPLRHLAGCPLLPPAHAHLQPRSPEELSSQSLQDSLSKLFIPR